jgi:hypothetical protein
LASGRHGTQHLGRAYCCRYARRNDEGYLIVTQPLATGDRPAGVPPGRYGRRRDPRPARRWLPALLLILVVAAALAIGVQLYRQYGRPAYVPRVLALPQTTDSLVTVRFEVRKDDPAPATCLVRARSHDGAEVGHADVAVPAGTRVEVTYALSTSQRAFAVDVPTCQPQRG